MSVCLVIRTEEEAHRLKEFALKVAGGMDEMLEIWVATEVKVSGDWVDALSSEGVESVKFFSGLDRLPQVMVEVGEVGPALLIVGKHPSDLDRSFSRDLFAKLPCQVLVVRLVDGELPMRGKILVPCAGGRNSRRALRVAHAWAGSQTVAFQMRANVDELSEVVGQKHLAKIVKKAGLDPELIHTKVVLGDDLTKALCDEVASEDYAMLLIGAQDSGTLKRKLFGMLPGKAMKGMDGLTMGVIRAERPVGHRMRQAVSKVIHAKVPQLDRDERLALFEEVESKSRWNFDFASLMVLATAIAAMGLLLDSAAVVIGAMLVAPLMMPLLGTGLALSQGNWPLCRRALGAVMRGFLFALLMGLGIGFCARLFDLGMAPQLEARGNPNLLDLGVAFVSGIAAAYCIARPKLSGALAGVAIAAALVPPIATVGIAFVLEDGATSRGAAFLFGINVVAVVLGAALNFVLAGVRGRGKDGEWGRRGLIILMLVCAGLVVPLTSILFSSLSKASDLEQLVSDELPEGIALLSVSRIQEGGYEITLESSEPVKKELHEKIREALGEKEKVRLRTILVID